MLGLEALSQTPVSALPDVAQAATQPPYDLAHSGGFQPIVAM